MSDPAVASAVEKITAFEGQTCGPAGQGGDSAATGDVDPEFADWCAATSAVDAGAGTDRGASRRRREGRSRRDQRRRRSRRGGVPGRIAKGDPGLGYGA